MFWTWLGLKVGVVTIPSVWFDVTWNGKHSKNIFTPCTVAGNRTQNIDLPIHSDL